MYDTRIFNKPNPFMEGEGMFPNYQLFRDQLNIHKNLFESFFKYNNEFLLPLLIATSYFSSIELSKVERDSPVEKFNAYMDLFEFNVDLMLRYFSGSFDAVEEYSCRETKNYVEAFYNSFFNLEGENLEGFFSRQSDSLEKVTQVLPQAIQDIEPEYGFHFERNRDIKFAETDRFIVYKILPREKGVHVDDTIKPVLIIPPFVLGYNILAFLPDEKKSYTHSFANQSIPTYIRVPKDISITPALQNMTLEEDVMDTRYFCEAIKKIHNKPVTLNGYCQGGYTAVCNYLTGKLDGLVDSLITCVAPMDGTRSHGLGNFLKSLPPRFNNLIYGTKLLLNGNKVADGDLMGWIYKLKSIEDESPIVSFFRDLFMVTSLKDKNYSISKTAAALNYWLQNEKCDLPLSITRMSFDSYNTPVTREGVLPVKIFDKELNFNRIREAKIAWLICYGQTDDLVEKETALAPLDYIDAEISVFPKGHAAMATSWSHPDSECALHKRFGEKNYRGPVRFHLDLNRLFDKAVRDALKVKKTEKAKKAKKAEKAEKAEKIKKAKK